MQNMPKYDKICTFLKIGIMKYAKSRLVFNFAIS